MDDEELVRELDELDPDDAGLSEWEINFIGDLYKRVVENGWSLTEKQREKAEEIHEQKG